MVTAHRKIIKPHQPLRGPAQVGLPSTGYLFRTTHIRLLDQSILIDLDEESDVECQSEFRKNLNTRLQKEIPTFPTTSQTSVLSTDGMWIDPCGYPPNLVGCGWMWMDLVDIPIISFS
jgi:hypothetical protein